MKKTTAYLMNKMLRNAVTSGTGGSVNFGGMAIAGKTGTTSDYNDVWFSGYTQGEIFYRCQFQNAFGFERTALIGRKTAVLADLPCIVYVAGRAEMEQRALAAQQAAEAAAQQQAAPPPDQTPGQ